jgi:hypothetical protein
MNDSETKELGAGIGAYLRQQSEARNDRRPLDRPAILADETANPEKKAAAEEAYTAALLNRRSLTTDEQAWLLRQITSHLKKSE